MMHSGHPASNHTSTHHLDHLNFLFSGRGSRLYTVTMVPLTRRLYRRVVEDLTLVNLVSGTVLDAGTGPGTLALDIARQQPGLQVYGVDLSKDMIQLAYQQAQRKQLTERVHFDVSNIAHLPYPDTMFDMVVSTISLHHWSELEQPFRELYRVLRPGGRLWIYDARFIQARTIENALARTPFAETPLEHTLIYTGGLPFAIYKRFAIQKMR